ncbi:MAG: leukotoxin LktA family filamentous adhesin [Vampirovibrionia bacterium]
MKYSPFNKAKNYYYLLLLLIYVISMPVLSQQVIIDGKTQTTITNNENISTITTKTVENNNAFNSFSKFNVDENKVVNLVFPENVENLINIIHDEATVINGILNSIKNNNIGGHIFLVNPHGIIIGQNGTINTGMLTAVTPTVDFVDNFFDTEGNLNNDSVISLVNNDVPINQNAQIIINGKIKASENVVLESYNITNTGNIGAGYEFENNVDLNDIVNIENLSNAAQINTVNSNIILVANNDISISGSIKASKNISLYSNDKIELDETSIIQTPGDIIINTKDLFINGKIDADGTKGGIINITGLKSVINGEITARGTNDSGGTINILSTADCWITSNTIIDASGTSGGIINNIALEEVLTSAEYKATGSTSNGGSIDIFAPVVKILSSTIDASGATDGGIIRLGGTSKDSVAVTENEQLFTSQSLVVNENSTISANSKGSDGNGGIIALNTEDNIIALGNYSAIEGINTGNNGIIEFRSGNTISYGATSTTSRDNETTNIIYSPDYIEIQADKDTNYSIITEFDDFTLWPNQQFKLEIISNYDNTISVSISDEMFKNTFIYSFTDENYNEATLIRVINENNFDFQSQPGDFQPGDGPPPGDFNMDPNSQPPPPPGSDNNDFMQQPNSIFNNQNAEYFMQESFETVDNPLYTPNSTAMFISSADTTSIDSQPISIKSESSSDTSHISSSNHEEKNSSIQKDDKKDEKVNSSYKDFSDSKNVNSSVNMNDQESTKKVFQLCKNKGACKELEDVASYQMMEQSIMPNNIAKEFDADTKGTQFIIKSGYNPAGLKGYLLTLAFIEHTIETSGQKDQVVDALIRHPDTPDRIKKLNKLMSHYKTEDVTYISTNKDIYKNIMTEEDIIIHNKKVRTVLNNLHKLIEKKVYTTLSNDENSYTSLDHLNISENLFEKD